VIIAFYIREEPEEVNRPGIGFGPDPIGYNTHGQHTNLDTFEHVIEGA